MQPIEVVIFDMAGTTVTDQHEVERCFAQAALETGLSVSDERILAMQGLSKRYVFETLWREQVGKQQASLTERVDDSYDAFRRILEHHYQTQGATPTAGCLDTFAYLHQRGIAVALTTGFYRVVTDIILEKLGWLDGLNGTRAEDLGYYTQDFINDLMLAEARRIVRFPITVKKTWAGFYSQTKAEIFEYNIDTNIRIVTGIGGKGMSSGAGYAEENIRQWFGY